MEHAWTWAEVCLSAVLASNSSEEALTVGGAFGVLSEEVKRVYSWSVLGPLKCLNRDSRVVRKRRCNENIE
jgi:hypothetical protein